MAVVFTGGYVPLTAQELAGIKNAEQDLKYKQAVLQSLKNQKVNLGNLVTLYQNLLNLRDDVAEQTGIFQNSNKKIDFSAKGAPGVVFQNLKGISKEENMQFVFSVPLKYKKSDEQPLYFTVFMNQSTVRYGIGAIPNSIITGLGISHVANQISSCNAYEVISSELGVKYGTAFDEISNRHQELFDKTKVALLSYVKECYTKQIEETEREIDEWR